MNLAELTERIMKSLEKENAKSLKEVRFILESIEKPIMDDIYIDIIDSILDYIEKTEKITSLEIYIYLMKQKEELTSEK